MIDLGKETIFLIGFWICEWSDGHKTNKCFWYFYIKGVEWNWNALEMTYDSYHDFLKIFGKFIALSHQFTNLINSWV